MSRETLVLIAALLAALQLLGIWVVNALKDGMQQNTTDIHLVEKLATKNHAMVLQQEKRLDRHQH